MDPPGQRVGGADTDTSSLTQDELRRRRLVAFQPTVTFLEEDPELQAALALSLKKDEDSPPGDEEDDDQLKEDFDLGPIPSAESFAAVAQSARPFSVVDFHSIMWDSKMTTDSDKSRWVGQAINVRDDGDSAGSTGNSEEASEPPSEQPQSTESAPPTIMEQLARSHLPWGLLQQHGGPCGVLAAVQAELLRILITTAERVTKAAIRQALGQSIALILARATLTPAADGSQQSPSEERSSVTLVLPSDPTKALSWEDLEPWDITAAGAASSALSAYTISSAPTQPSVSIADSSSRQEAGAKRQKTESDDEGGEKSLHARVSELSRAVTHVLLQPLPGSCCPLDSFQRPGGVLLLVMSLVASRTRAVLRKEFDDPSGTLTSQFGHSSQELINLLLTGQAVSNVFDNTLTPSGEMVCRGIQARPWSGYLSLLESLRYVEVGSFYKSPRTAIWVVGSSSHFTVLFGDREALAESKSDRLLEQCRRAFKSVEGGAENGFIATDQLVFAVGKLGLALDGEAAVAALGASLETTGTGIILWDDFWKATSRLMTGASLEAVLEDNEARSPAVINVDDDDDVPPLLRLERGDAGATPPAFETDEDMARRLQAEWEEDGPGMFGNIDGMSALTEAARAASPMEVDTTGAVSDEELARRIQAEYDAETTAVSGGLSNSSVTAVPGSPSATVLSDTEPMAAIDSSTQDLTEEEDSKPAAAQTGAENTQSHDFEKYGDTFNMYHYNGLRGGTLTAFRITRLSAEEAVGASIALNRVVGGGGGAQGSNYSADLEDVLRTKWPSCMINWLGNAPPYID